MANKFIVFVAFAAVAQASLASATESSTVENARDRSRTSWRAAGETICKAVRNGSWPVAEVEEEFQQHIDDGVSAFFEVAPYGDYEDLQDEVKAHTDTIRKGVFQAMEDATTLIACVTTVAGIEQNRRELPYAELAESLQKCTTDTGPTLRAEFLHEFFYQTIFTEISHRAIVTCGRQESLDACDTELIYSATDAAVDDMYGWIEE